MFANSLMGFARDSNGENAADQGKESGSLPDKQHIDPRLTHIAKEVAGDHSIIVCQGKAGGGSYANLDSRVLTLDSNHIAECGAFIAAHEGAHIRDTATFKQLGVDPRELAKKLGLLALKNVVEDGAINDRFVRDFPKLTNDTLAAYTRVEGEVGVINHPEVIAHASALGFPPKYARGLCALLQDWSELRHTLGFNKADTEYLNAPYMGPELNDKELETFIKRVLPNFRRAVATKYSSQANGQEMIEAAKQRHRWCEDVLYPELQKLVESDLKRLMEEALSTNQAASKSGSSETGQSDSSPSKEEGSAAKGDIKNISEAEQRRRAQETLAAFDDALRDALKSQFDKQDDAPKAAEVVKKDNDAERKFEVEEKARAEFQEGVKGLRDAMLRNLSPYQRYYIDVVAAIDQIADRLKDVFIPNMHFRWERNQPSGPKINMTQAMRFEATGEGYRELFERRIDPTHLDIGVVVLVDRSGSMGGEKIESAIRGAIFTKEIFQRVGIRCAVVGFADEQKLLCGFEDDTQEPEVQERVMRGLELAGGTRDASALRYATGLLENLGSRRGAIVVISDAQSGEDGELRRVVSGVEGSGIPVVHFGIGSDTDDTKGYYKRSFGGLEPANVPGGFFEVFAREMEKLAEELF
jgi:uncharacterized protein with von Willebrand factor type A (vWA) domain